MKTKPSTIVLVALCLLCLALDLRLFQQIQSIANDVTTLPISCKAVMLDWLNSYLLSPLTRLIDKWTHFSRIQWLTANHVSFMGVLAAAISGRLVASDSLVVRRVGVLVFLVRQLLDDADGYVARVRAGVDPKHEVSMRESSGFAIDGICDALGFALFIFGLFLSQKRKENKFYSSLNEDKVRDWSLLRNFALFSALLLLSCALWNRYIAAFEALLETHVNRIRVELFRSRLQWLIMWCWRALGNAHQLMLALLVAVWLNRATLLILFLRIYGFVLLFSLGFLSEVHVHDVSIEDSLKKCLK